MDFFFEIFDWLFHIFLSVTLFQTENFCYDIFIFTFVHLMPISYRKMYDYRLYNLSDFANIAFQQHRMEVYYIQLQLHHLHRLSILWLPIIISYYYDSDDSNVLRDKSSAQFLFTSPTSSFLLPLTTPPPPPLLDIFEKNFKAMNSSTYR